MGNYLPNIKIIQIAGNRLRTTFLSVIISKNNVVHNFVLYEWLVTNNAFSFIIF